MGSSAMVQTDKTQVDHEETVEYHKDGNSDIVVNESAEDPTAKHLERRLKWKLDLFILPIISFTYFFSSMARSDLGNAAVAGMADELKLSPKDYSNAASVFLVGYIAFQLPGTVLLKAIGPPLQFSTAIMMWGIFTALSVLIPDSPTLLGLRFLIGTAEAFVQGAVFYLSFWYTYRELATRGAIVFSTSALAGAFNGLISYGIASTLEGKNGWRAWRWIFLIEGIMPIFASFFVLALLPSTPQQTRFGFDKAEIALAERRSLRAHNSPDAKLEWKKILTPLWEIHFWLITIISCAGHFCISSLSNFLPAIINGFGYSEVNSQLMSVIVYASAFAGILFWARVADKTNARGLTLAASSATAVIGYGLLIGLENDKARLAATCIAAFGVYPNIVLTLSWMAMSIAGFTKRGAATAFINIFAQMVSIGGNQAYIDPPFYKNGNTASLCLSALCGLTALLTSLYFKRVNARKLREKDSDTSNALRLKSIYEIGDKHPDFFYTT